MATITSCAKHACVHIPKWQLVLLWCLEKTTALLKDTNKTFYTKELVLHIQSILKYSLITISIVLMCTCVTWQTPHFMSKKGNCEASNTSKSLQHHLETKSKNSSLKDLCCISHMYIPYIINYLCPRLLVKYHHCIEIACPTMHHKWQALPPLSIMKKSFIQI